MIEWLYLAIGMAWGMWINLNDANYYKKLTKLQERYIKILLEELDERES